MYQMVHTITIATTMTGSIMADIPFRPHTSNSKYSYLVPEPKPYRPAILCCKPYALGRMLTNEPLAGQQREPPPAPNLFLHSGVETMHV
jgi:hypothetical protein